MYLIITNIFIAGGLPHGINKKNYKYLYMRPKKSLQYHGQLFFLKAMVNYL